MPEDKKTNPPERIDEGRGVPKRPVLPSSEEFAKAHQVPPRPVLIVQPTSMPQNSTSQELPTPKPENSKKDS